MTKKEEFEEIFIEEATIRETGEQFRYIEYDNELWSWIENEIRQAKIGTAERIKEFVDEDYSYPINQIILELEKEK